MVVVTGYIFLDDIACYEDIVLSESGRGYLGIVDVE